MTDTLQQYYRAYVEEATNSNSQISKISQIPSEVPLETLIALTAYNPTVFGNALIQKNTQNSAIVQAAVAQRLQNNGILVENFDKFRPSVLSGNAIQRRTNGITTPLNNRDRILRGLDPRTQQLVQQLEDLRNLSELQAKLARILDKVEKQITKITALFNALVNAPDAAASAALTLLIGKLEDLQNAYDKIKAVYELTKKIYQNTKKAILKALGKDIPKAKENLKKGLTALSKILRLREIPRITIYPKFPKLPKVSFSFGDFYGKYKKALETLKKKDGEFYQKAYSTAVQQAGFEIIDPRKDKIQRGLTKARNSLREARAKLQTSQAVRTEAVNRARTQLIDNIRNVNATTERERLRILQQYENAKRVSTQVGTRKLYLNSTETAQLLRSSRVDTSVQNIYKDFPTGQITPDGRTVYFDSQNGKVYTLQSPQERVNELVSKSTTTLRNTIQETSTALNIVNTAVASTAQVAAGLNNKVLKAQFGVNLIQEVSTVNNIANQARSATSTPVEELTTSTKTFEFSIDRNNKTVTTISRRLQPSVAINDATLQNAATAASVGYSGVLQLNATPPMSKILNGQQLFEVKVIVTYASQSAVPSIQVNQAQVQELNRLAIASIQQVQTPVTVPVTVQAPVPPVPPLIPTSAPTSSIVAPPPAPQLTPSQQLDISLTQQIQGTGVEIQPDIVFVENTTITTTATRLTSNGAGRAADILNTRAALRNNFKEQNPKDKQISNEIVPSPTTQNPSRIIYKTTVKATYDRK